MAAKFPEPEVHLALVTLVQNQLEPWHARLLIRTPRHCIKLELDLMLVLPLDSNLEMRLCRQLQV